MNQITSVPTTTDKDRSVIVTDQHAIDERDAQAWFDAHPDPERELVSSVLRANRVAVWEIIFARLTPAKINVAHVAGMVNL
ncbi:hypothetical protein [Cryobacterium sp. TMS1-13-1]|uniref:hypothetical protein n=1 Tax=Cryobacterium sp. TMS1-13-1 TaxID=1259220 RepID=UPI00106CCC80|nr:hypothetical protein [Cryobacterium sp. TMS1-13-1]TFD22131.1 hypothetical protein E3T31_08600 [Cryobacterium sp. TMS1-13-1]